MYTEILCGWIMLSGNRTIDWAECKHGIQRDSAQLYAYVRHTHVLPTYCTEEVFIASILLSSGDVLESGSNYLHRRETSCYMVARANLQLSVRFEDAKLEDDLPLDIREIFGQWKSKRLTSQGKKSRSQGNQRKIQQGQIHSQKRQNSL